MTRLDGSLDPLSCTAAGDDPAARTLRALAAWRRGESGYGYREFRALISPDFGYFSHPLLGPRYGPEARLALNALLAERERCPGALRLTDIVCFEQPDMGIVRYHASGLVGGTAQLRYDGPTVILFFFSGAQIRGFEASLGWFDPAWCGR